MSHVGHARLPEGFVDVDDAAFEAMLDDFMVWRRTHPDADPAAVLTQVQALLDPLVPPTHRTGSVSVFWQRESFLSHHSCVLTPRARRWVARALWDEVEPEYRDARENQDGLGNRGTRPRMDEVDPRDDPEPRTRDTEPRTRDGGRTR